MKHYPNRLRYVVALALLAVTATTLGARGSSPPRRGESEAEERDESRQIEQRQRWFVESHALNKTKDARRKRSNALHSMKREMTLQRSTNLSAGEVWTSIGPAAMKMGQMGLGPVSGRITAVTPHPSDENTVYIGTAAGGIWKTSNAGASWTALFDSVGTQPIGSIYIEPNDPQSIWVGTGDRNGVCGGYLSEGVFQSADGGATWTPKNGSGATAMALGIVNTIVRQPNNTNVLLAGGFERNGYGCGSGDNNALYRTADRGATWTRVLDLPIEDIVFVPNSSTAYATAVDAGVYKSIDGGATWTSIGTGIVPTSRMRLAIAPSDPNTIYVLTQDDLYRSSNAGVSWVKRHDAPCEGQCLYNLALAVSPTNPNEVLVGSFQVQRSTDGGTTLAPINSDAWIVHPDIHVLRYSATNGNRLWVGSDGGLWRTDNGGTTFANMNSNLNITQFYDVTPDPNNVDIVYGGAQDNSSSRRTTSNEWEMTAQTGDGFVNLVDASNSNIVLQTSYPSQYPTILRSTQGGAPNTFQNLPTTGIESGSWSWKTPVASAGSNIFVASEKVYRGLIAAEPFAWTPISNAFSSYANAITALRTGSTTRVYVGTKDNKLFFTADATAASVTWTDVTGPTPLAQVYDIAIDPTNVQRVFVSLVNFGGVKLYGSTTGGSNWTALGSNLPDVPTKTVAIDPLNTSRIFVGNELGVYVSENGGQSFAPFVTGFPLGTPVEDLEIDDNPHVLIAGTFGRGAWKVPLATSGNQLPVAGFSYVSNNLFTTFTDSSTDADGSIVTRNWNFGDGTSSSATSPSKTYTAAGTYTVVLTVTDNAGGVDTETKTVTVSSGNVLSNGVPVTGLSAAIGVELRYTMVVPANATGLKFVTTGSNGDADLYAKFGSAPTTTSYTCRSEASGSNETCTITTAQAGTYHVLVKAYSAFSGLSLTGSYTVGGTTQTYTNGTDVAIPNNATVESSIAVTGRTGNAPSNAQIAVNIIHTYIGDLKVDLVAPDGSVYILHNRAGGSTDNINQTYTVNLTSEPLNGTWKLRVNDNYQTDSGYINSWSITF